jgi:hypothetical protein
MYHHDRGRNTAWRARARAIDCARSLSRLTTLHLQLRHRWEDDLPRAVYPTSDLVELSVVAQNKRLGGPPSSPTP